MKAPIDWRGLHGAAFEGARVLVTGGAGFIGSHLVEALAELGASVAVLDDLSTGRIENLNPKPTEAKQNASPTPGQSAAQRSAVPDIHSVAPTIDFHHGSILDREQVARAIAGVRYVFHEAAMASVPMSIERPRDFYDVNVTGTLNVLEAAREARVSRIMFAASSSAYGDSEILPKIETMPPMPMSPYASSKMAGEGLMRAWANCYGIDTVSLRYFNIFGPRQSADSAYAAVIAAFAKAMLGGNRPTIFGDGEQSRDFTYVANAVHANLLAARAAHPLKGDVFNVACGKRVSLNDLARVMSQALGAPDLVPVYQPVRAGDVRHSLADLTHIRSGLDYEPIVDFESGLRATIEWYRSAP